MTQTDVASADPVPTPVPAPAPALPPAPVTPDGPGGNIAIPIAGANLGPQGLNVLGQANGDSPLAAALGAPSDLSGLDRGSVLGQYAVPSAPGQGGPVTAPNLRAFNNAYGTPQCLKPSAPGKCEQFGVDAGQESEDVTGRQWLGRYIDMYRDGRLKGGLLGQVPREQLGESLPGTAPPPGTNIPPGLVEFRPDPADVPPPPGAPVPPVPPAPAN
ncbi:hypothetical protein ACNO8X_00090 [Mycobacterium sp. PDNC021]|uniref:hypothetical protein n=1 Tax=Mycobacterium sp. PDNC021 TaxID=3391399 RepID=UPI003AADF4CC